MTWKPTPGLYQAESAMQTIERDAAALGCPLAADPSLRWRIVQIIANSIDSAIAKTTGQPVGNGHAMEDWVYAPPVAPPDHVPPPVTYPDGPDTAEEAADPGAHTMASIKAAVTAAMPKRRRGRPPGKKKKPVGTEAHGNA